MNKVQVYKHDDGSWRVFVPEPYTFGRHSFTVHAGTWERALKIARFHLTGRTEP